MLQRYEVVVGSDPAGVLACATPSSGRADHGAR